MNLVNENGLLTYCAQKNLSETAKARIERLLTGPLQWHQVADRAISEGIAPLVYNTLKKFRGSGLIPDDKFRILQHAYYGNLARNIQLFTELSRVLEVFRDNYVDVMVLKGAALADTVYGDIGLRPMADIDLLVKEKDLDRSKKIMSSMNYEMGMNAPEEWYKKHHFHLPPFYHREKSIGIEVHWNIANKSFPVDIDKWWERAFSTELNSTSALIPSPEDMLLHLCLHLHHQMYKPLILKRGICDFSETLRYYEGTVDLEFFEREAKTCGLSKITRSMLYLVNKHFSTERAEPIAPSDDSTDMEFIRILEDRLFRSSDFPGLFIFYYAAEGTWNKAATLLRVVFPERDVMGSNYSVAVTSWKLYLYYCIRPIDLILKYWKEAFSVFGRKKVWR